MKCKSYFPKQYIKGCKIVVPKTTEKYIHVVQALHIHYECTVQTVYAH